MYPVTPESSARGEEAIFLSPGDPLTIANVKRLSLETPCSDDVQMRGGLGLRATRSSGSTRSKTTTKSKGRKKPIPEPRKIIYDDFIRIDDWDHYGKVPKLLKEYEEAMASIEGSKTWTDDQKLVHKLSFMRGHHPMIPSWWRLYYKMWGITLEELDDVFTPIDEPRRVVIHAYGNELAGGKALESLFYLSQYVKDSEQIGEDAKIAPMIVKAIKGYYKWALIDAGLRNFKVKRTMIVVDYKHDFHETPSVSDDEMDLDPTNDRRGEDFIDAVSRDLERRLVALADSWRTLLWDKRTKSYAMRPPTLYAFAVIQHIVMLVSLDSADENNAVIILNQIRLNDRGQWLWNALSLAIPISIIRDAIHHTRNPRAIVPRDIDEEDDPDE
ncbi:hypothetical protein V8F06_007550 [Rhypophila decipiens]